MGRLLRRLSSGLPVLPREVSLVPTNPLSPVPAAADTPAASVIGVSDGVGDGLCIGVGVGLCIGVGVGTPYSYTHQCRHGSLQARGNDLAMGEKRVR